MTLSLKIIKVLFLSTFACGFNIDKSCSNIIVRSEEKNNAFSNSPRRNFTEKTFFGYNMFLDFVSGEYGNSIQLAVSAPLQVVLASKSNTDDEDLVVIEPSPQKRSPSSISTPAMGAVYLCDVLQSRFMNLSESKTYNCSRRAFVERHLTGVEISDRDALGMSILGQPLPENESYSLLERNTLTTCSPLRLRECGSSSYRAEGACYFSHATPGRGDSELVIEWQKRTPCRESCLSKNIDLMYVIDGSYSVGEANFKKVKQWIKDVTNGFDVTEQVQVGVVQYSYYNETYDTQRWIRTEIPLGKYKDKERLDAEIDRIAYHGYKTYTAHAIIKTVREDFMEPTSRYPKARRVMILLTDGRADDKDQLPNATKYATDNGVESFAIGIGDYDLTELNLIAGDEDRVLTVEDFENLNEIVSRLQNEIQVLEGSSSPDQHNGLTHCQAGFSTATDKTGGLYLGAVGAWDWSGTIVKYDNSEDQTPDIPDFTEVQKVLANWTKESYLGYALTSGFYNGNPPTNEYVAIGAPRYKLEGAVVIYRPRPDNANFTDAVTIYPNSYTSQLGSYFGGAMLSEDINNDGQDDLLVGAPLYIGTNYDDGRVYVFLTNGGSSNPTRWAEASYEPIVLSGNSPGGRFGSSIASAGDLNKDGFNDFIVGAPYTDNNKGAIYIFHGSSAGMNRSPTQIIRASSLSNDYLQYFGLSIQAGQDLDRNGYPDVAVGAPKSDAVVIFRTRPVVILSGTLAFSEPLIDVFRCFEIPDRRCLTLSVCLSVEGEGIEDTIPVNFTVSLDSLINVRENKRVEFASDTFETDRYMRQGIVNVSSSSANCLMFSYNITVKGTIADYSTPIQAIVTYEVASTHTDQPLSSLRDPSLPNNRTADTNFARDCGADMACVYNLTLSTDISLPPTTLNVSGEGTVLVVSEQSRSTPIIVRVNLTNVGENAFDVRVTVNYTRQLNMQPLWNIQSSNPDQNIACVEAETQDTVIDSMKLRQLTYRYSTSLGSIMQNNQWCYFQFNLTSPSLRDDSTVPELNVEIYAHTPNNDDGNSSDDLASKTFEIRYNTDAEISERNIVETTVPFNFTSEDRNILSVRQIGENTSDIQIQYQVNGRGYANIPLSQISLSYPYSMLNNPRLHLLYPYTYTCFTEGTASCTCDDSVINPYNLATGFTITNETSNVTAYANPNVITGNAVFDCSTPEGMASVECNTLTCNVSNLGENDNVNIRVSFRLWSQSLNLANNSLSVTFRSGFTYNTELSELLISNDGQPDISLRSTVRTFARLFTHPEVIADQNNLWIYIVAAVGGLLLLVLIVIILWKTGFFKSKYAEKKEALEWTEAPDGDESGSSSDMMKK